MTTSGPAVRPAAMPPWAARLRLLLRVYAIFGAGHFIYKLLAGLMRRWRRNHALRNIPCIDVPIHPFLGMIPGLVQNMTRLNDWRMEISAGRPMTKFLGPVWDDEKVMLFVKDPLIIRHFLKDAFDKYTKPDAKDDWIWVHFTTFLGNGIFTTQHGVGAPDKGELWRRQRKIASNIFSRANFNTNMHCVFVAKAQQLQSFLEDGKPTDMQMSFFNFTMDSIMKIFFGEESNTMCGERNAYGHAFDQAHRGFFEYGLTSMPFITLASMLPWPFGGYKGVCAWLHQRQSRDYREFIENVAIIQQESRKIIDRCRSDPNLPERTDLLALFMQATEKEGGSDAESAKYLSDTVLNFIIAGRDTTACALSWMFYILSTNPDIQRRVQAEIDEKLPGNTVPTLTLVHHNNMPLLHALLYETLRLHPPVPFDFKEAQCDDVLPDGTTVRRGTKMLFLPYAMGRDAEVYPEPELVKLERWLPFKQPQPHEFPVFQAGPRICLGIDMAIFETKVLASILLQKFSFSLKEGEAEKIHYNRTLTMSVCNSKEQDSHNLWLIPHKRARSAP